MTQLPHHVKVVREIVYQFSKNPQQLSAKGKFELMRSTSAVVNGIYSCSYEEMAIVGKGLRSLKIRHLGFEDCVSKIVYRYYNNIKNIDSALDLLYSLSYTQSTESVVLALRVMELPVRIKKLIFFFQELCERRIAVTAFTSKVKLAVASSMKKALEDSETKILGKEDSILVAGFLSSLSATDQIDEKFLLKCLEVLKDDFSAFKWTDLSKLIFIKPSLLNHNSWTDSILSNLFVRYLSCIPSNTDYYIMEPLVSYVCGIHVPCQISNYLDKFKSNNRVVSLLFFHTAQRMVVDAGSLSTSKVIVENFLPTVLKNLMLQEGVDSVAAAYSLCGLGCLRMLKAFYHIGLQGKTIYLRTPKGGQPLQAICTLKIHELGGKMVMRRPL